MSLQALLNFWKPWHRRRRAGAGQAVRRRRPRRAVGLERLEDRCLLDSTFSQLLTTEHVDLAGFDYIDGAWDVAVEIGDTSPTTQIPPDQALLWVDPAAQLTQPDGPEWAFLGAGAGNPVWILPQSQNSQVLFLGGAAEDTPSGTFAPYFESDPRVGGTFAWIRWSLQAVRGPGQFALYQTDFAGTPIVWMSTADGIGAADVTFIPEQGHVHFNWAFSQRGFYEVDIQASAFLNDGQMTPATSPVVTFYFSVDPVLQVTSLTPTATGFTARFNRPIDPSTLDVGDVTLTGPSGEAVQGSLAIEGLNSVTFTRDEGALEPGDYTVTLRSGSDAFRTTALGTASLLDGNSDGTDGDDFVSTFTVPPSGANSPPTLVALADQTIPADQDPLTVPLSATDPDGDPLTFAAAGQSLAFALDQQLGLFFAGDLFENWGGQGERWLLGAGDVWYFILPNGELYQWDGASGTPLANVGASYWSQPELLYNAQEAAALDQQLELFFAGDLFENAGGQGERWLLGAGDVWYFILPNGELYQWDGGPGASGTLVASLGGGYHSRIHFLYDGQDGQAPATLSIEGNNLVIDRDDDFIGSLVIGVTVSDGRGGTDTLAFTVTVTST